jgi:hypothetical protein
MTTQKEYQTLVMSDPFVGEIHDRLLDENDLDLAHAFNSACVEISVLIFEIQKLEEAASSGFIRKKPPVSDV